MADEETFKVMLKAADRERDGWLNSNALSNFPCQDLQTIDQIWVAASKGKFGFSVQKELYLKCDGILDWQYHADAWRNFCQENGWQVNNSYVPVTYSTQSPKGHLPSIPTIARGIGRINNWSGEISSLASRLADYEWRASMEDLFSRIQACRL